jgi:plastocyanin
MRARWIVVAGLGALCAAILLPAALGASKPLGGSPQAARGYLGRAGATSSISAPAVPPAAAAPSTCGPVWSLSVTPDAGQDSFLNEIAMLSANDAWAVGAAGRGTTLAQHWDGTAWTIVSTPNVGTEGNYLYGVAAASSTDVWAVGANIDQVTLYHATLIEHWDGTAWTVTPSPNVGTGDNFLNAVSARSATDVWAVGYYEDDVGSVFSLIEHWDGATWSVVPSSNPAASGNYLYGVTARTGSDAWAVGYFYSATAGTLQSLVEHWDGRNWRVTASPNVDSAASLLTDVAPVTGKDAWAVGFANGATGFDTLILHWNGLSWSVSSHTDLGGRLFGVKAVSRGDVYAIGGGNDSSALVEHYDGTAWSVVATQSSFNSGNVLYGLAALSTGPVQVVGYRAVRGGGSGGGNAPLDDHSATMSGQLCSVLVTESGFSPSTVSGTTGATVAWSFSSANTATHSVTDNSGMGLYDSGLRLPGSSYTFIFVGAGTYSVIDMGNSSKGSVKVPLTLNPLTGHTSTTFTVTWASASPPAGYVFDVQIRRPGSSTYEDWKTNQTATSATFLPDSGTGRYYFQGRLRNTANGQASGYSPKQFITVT